MSLATRVFLLTLVAAVPIFGILIAQERQLRYDRRAEIIIQANNAASVAATRVARAVTSAKGGLLLASRIPAVRSLDPVECTHELAGLAAGLPGVAGISAWSPKGDAYCSSIADAPRIDISDREYFRDALKSKDFVVSDYIVGRTMRR